jgi:hypothetical protein
MTEIATEKDSYPASLTVGDVIDALKRFDRKTSIVVSMPVDDPAWLDIREISKPNKDNLELRDWVHVDKWDNDICLLWAGQVVMS